MLCAARRFLGVVVANPDDVSSDTQLLGIHLRVASQRMVVLVITSLFACPIIYKASSSISMSKEADLREFLDTQEATESVRIWPVVEEDGPSYDVPFRKGTSSTLYSGLVKPIKVVYVQSVIFLQSGLELVCSATTAVCGGRGGGRDLPRRLVSFVLQNIAQRVVMSFIAECVTQLCFFGVCKFLDQVLIVAQSSPQLSHLAKPFSGDDGSFLGMYKLGDFSVSVRQFGGRWCATYFDSVLYVAGVLFCYDSNTYWWDARAADAVWSRLTPTGFFLTTALRQIRPLLWKGVVELLRYVEAKWNRTTELRSGEKSSSGTITLGKEMTGRQMLSTARQYLISINVFGAPLVAYIAARYAWKKEKKLFYCHNAGPLYETVAYTSALLCLPMINVKFQNIDNM